MSKHFDAPLIEYCRDGDQICSEGEPIVGDPAVEEGSEGRSFIVDEGGGNGEETPLSNNCNLSAVAYKSGGNKRSVRRPSHSVHFLRYAAQQIGLIAHRINLPQNIIDRANNLFKQAYESRNVKGRSQDAMISASLYMACRQEGVPHSLNEICTVSKVSKKVVGRTFKQMLKALETNVDPIAMGSFVSRFCCKLRLSSAVQRVAAHIVNKAVELDLVTGRSPTSVAALAIYMASQASEEKRTQKEICDIACVAINKPLYNLLQTNASLLVPEDFKLVDQTSKLSMS